MIPDNLPEKLAFDYEFIEKIGEGANGETWLAQHRFNRIKAAVKCLKLDKIDDIKTLELFNRESELLKSVKVDGVPRFYDYYPAKEGGNGYLVQEYIQAPSIQSMLDDGIKFSEQQTIIIAEQIANILYHLEMEYQPPIIHRDIKPSNILYSESDSKVWLIDFGAVTNPQKRTGGSTVAGTFGYMPPEQMMGNVTIQSDYYALGATLLHIITGIPPYKLDANVFTIDLESTFKSNSISISDRFKHFLERLLSPEIDKRPKNAIELMDEIQIAKGIKTIEQNKRFFVDRILKTILGWFIPIGVRDKYHDDKKSKNLTPRLSTIRSLERRIAGGENLPNCGFAIRNWMRCDGILRNSKQFKSPQATNAGEYVPGVEYTFEVDGCVWGGFCNGFAAIQFPQKCSVLYNPNDPRENALEFIYGIDD